MEKQTTGQEDNINQTHSVSLLDIILILSRNIKFMLLFTVSAAAFIVLYSIFTITAPTDHPLNKLPTVYTPEVKVRLQESAGSGLSNSAGASGGSELGLLGSLAGMGQGPSNSDLAQAIVVGNRLVDIVTKEHNFLEVYKLKEEESPITKSRILFTTNLSISYDDSSGILTLGYTDTDKEFATQVLTTTLIELDSLFKALTMEGITNRKTFLENSLQQSLAELESAQNNLINFQKENNIFNFNVQSQQQIQSIISINNEIIQKQVQLLELKEIRNPNDPQIVRLEKEIENLRQYMTYLNSGFEDFDAIGGIPQDKLPEISVEYAKLESELSIAKSTVQYLRQQYELVKIEEADDTKQFQIIERAEIPEIKSGPSRGKISMIFTIAMGFLSIFIAFIREYINTIKKAPEENAKLQEIKANLHIFKRKNKTKKE